MKHLASEAKKSFTGMGKQGVIGSRISVQTTVNQVLKLGVADCNWRLFHELTRCMDGLVGERVIIHRKVIAVFSPLRYAKATDGKVQKSFGKF